MRFAIPATFVTLFLTPLCLARPQDSRIGPYRPGRPSGNVKPAPESSNNPPECRPAKPVDEPKARAVVKAFQFAWKGYRDNALPNGSYNPVSNTASNFRNGWGVTAVDSLSTAIVMGLPTIVNEILDHIDTIDFTKSQNDQSVNLFETTIRYLGGMLSGYDLLNDPALACLAKDSKKVDRLLEQARTLADQLKFAFDTKSGVPAGVMFFGNKSTDGLPVNVLAGAGSLVLEWTRLSDLLVAKDKQDKSATSYAEVAQKAEKVLLNPKPQGKVPFPGLSGTNVSLSTGMFEDEVGGWIGGDDSFYEYLIKMFVYDSERFGDYKDRWVTAVDSSIKNLASSPPKHNDLTFFSYFMGQQTVDVSEHLSCFYGANLMLGGQVLGRKDYTKFGEKLISSCRQTYVDSVTGIGPEIFGWNASAIPQGLNKFYDKNGWYQLDGVYALRPELLESYYHAWQFTKDAKYRDWAWEAFQAINKACKVGSGFSGIKDVSKENGGGFLDSQESFFFAETLKYAYLTLHPQAPWDVGYEGENHWVFNTEGHPVKVAGQPQPSGPQQGGNYKY